MHRRRIYGQGLSARHDELRQLHFAAVAHDPYAALRIKNYRWFIVSVLTMTISSQIQAVVVAWQIYDITHDPLSLGLMGLAEALPFIAAAPFGGHIADSMNRH